VADIRCPYCGSRGFSQIDDGPLDCMSCGRYWFSVGMHDTPPMDGSVTELHIWPGLPASTQ